jgi:F0F1-type ATP synthase epsilon subunit
MSDEIDLKIEQHHAGYRVTGKRAKARIDRVEARKQLASAQSALAQAIEPEAIAAAQRAVAEALTRLRALA